MVNSKVWFDKDFNCIVKTTSAGIEQSRMSIDEIDLIEFPSIS